MNNLDFTIERMGEAKIDSPLGLSSLIGDDKANYVRENERVLYDVTYDACENCKKNGEPPKSMEKAGPRSKIFFDPVNTRAGIVTCGGLCPGINNVIRALVMELWYHYRVKKIYGFSYGFAGLNPEEGHKTLDLTPDAVTRIHHQGGTILGSSRGPQDPAVMVDTLDRMDVRILFVIGGDGTLKGTQAIHEEIKRRGLKIAVIGIPKTIDNDIQFVEKTFGFETAFSIAIRAIRSAHTEAEGAPNGIGLVRLMGRHSGYIAATAALAEPDVNMVLVPEVPFTLSGENGIVPWLIKRLDRRGHAVIVVAEGAGQDLIPIEVRSTDPSGNVKLGDIGLFLKRNLADELKARKITHAIKYIDPSYIIRSAPANANDSLYCAALGQHAAHAGMSGRTGMFVSSWNNMFTHVPFKMATHGRKVIDPEGDLWRQVLETTGQASE